MGEVPFDVPAHPLDLTAHRSREVVLAGGIGTVDVFREHRERRLQTVREIAGLRDGARDTALSLFEQPVEIVDERHDLGGVLAVEPGAPAVANGGQTVAQHHQR